MPAVRPTPGGRRRGRYAGLSTTRERNVARRRGPIPAESADLMLSLLLSSAFLATLVHVSITDARERRIANGSVLLLVALYGVHAAADTLRPIAADLALALVVLLAGVALWRFRIVGGGDAKLLAALSLWAGVAWFWGFVQVTTLVGGALAVLVWLRREHGWRLAAAVPRGLADRVIGLVTADGGPREAGGTTSVPYGVALAAGGAWLWLVKLTG